MTDAARPCGASNALRPALDASAVPHTIHQSWKTCEPLPAQARLRSSCAALHPRWDLVLWDDSANRLLIAEHYPDFVSWYDALNLSIYRADAVRLFYLHRYGGVYLDLDFACLRPLSRVVHSQANTFYVGRQHDPTDEAAPRPWRRGAGPLEQVANAFMAAPPRHAFTSYLLRRVRTVSLRKPWSLGPPFLTAAVRAYQQEAQATSAPLTLLDFCTIYGVQWNERHVCDASRLEQCAALMPRSVTTTFWMASWHAPRASKRQAVGTCFDGNAAVNATKPAVLAERSHRPPLEAAKLANTYMARTHVTGAARAAAGPEQSRPMASATASSSDHAAREEATACPVHRRKLSPRDFKARMGNCTRLTRLQFYSTVHASPYWWVHPPMPQTASACSIGRGAVRAATRAVSSPHRVGVGLMAQSLFDPRSSDAQLLDRVAHTWLMQRGDWLRVMLVHHCPLTPLTGKVRGSGGQGPNMTVPPWMAEGPASRIIWRCMPAKRRRANKSFLFHKLSGTHLH